MKKTSIFWLLGLGIAFLTFIVITICLRGKAELLQKAIAERQRTQLQLAMSIGQDIETLLSQVALQVSRLAEMPEWTTMACDPNRALPQTQYVIKELRRCYEKIGDKVEELSVLDYQGITRYSLPDGKGKIGINWAHSAPVASVIQTHSPIIGQPLAYGNRIHLVTIYPICTNKGENALLQSMLKTELCLPPLQPDFPSSVTPYPYSISLLSKDRIIVVHPQNKYIGQVLGLPNRVESSPATGKSVTLEEMLAGKSGCGVYQNSWNRQEVVAYVPITSNIEVFHNRQAIHNLTVIVSVSLEQIMQDVSEEWQKWILYTALLLGMFYSILLVLYRTIQKQSKLEQERKFQNYLFRTDKMASLSRLALGMAHEVNNPLAVISGYTEALLRRAKKNPVFTGEDLQDFPEYLEIINKQIFRCKDICQRLLNFARQEKPHFQTVDINQIAHDTMLLLQKTAEKAGVTLECDLPAEIPHVMGDQGQIRQLFFNLLMNGIEHKSHDAAIKPKVTLTTRWHKPYVVVAVRDNGEGIPKKLQTKIFEPFFTTKPSGQGTGLGLSIAQQIVKEHNGTITFQSKIKEGTVFEVSLPGNTPLPG